MPSFVRGLDVDIDKIGALQGRQRVFGLTLVVGVEVPGNTRHLDDLQARALADAAHQVNSRDDAALQPVALRQRRQPQRATGSPEPYRVGWPLPTSRAGYIDRRGRENGASRVHEGADSLSSFTCRLIRGHGLAHDVVRRIGFHFFRAAIPHQQVAIAHSRIEAQRRPSQLSRQSLHQFGCFFAINVAGAVIDQHVALSVDQVHAEGHPIVAQIDAHTRSFQRRAARVVHPAVVPENFEVADVAAWMPLRRDHLHQSPSSLAGQAIHARRCSRLQRRLPVQFVERIVRRPIGHQHHVAHARDPPCE